MQVHRITLALVCYTAVFGVVKQRALRDDTKNGCVADYSCTHKKGDLGAISVTE